MGSKDSFMSPLFLPDFGLLLGVGAVPAPTPGEFPQRSIDFKVVDAVLQEFFWTADFSCDLSFFPSNSSPKQSVLIAEYSKPSVQPWLQIAGY